MKFRIDKQELREKIQNLQGLSNEDKSQLLALLAEQKKYGLVWEDSKEEAEEVLRDNIPVLREVTERRILSKETFMGEETDKESPNHILIEGDNLHALTALTYTHEGKVDVIYIDPPYNTGNKDFVYNDSFVDSEDGYRHSKWLSFMEKRLRIAKKLLSDKGVIFISIDDNEQANLKLLCDEVFGEDKFLINIVWEKRFTRSNNSKKFATLTENVLCYSKTDLDSIKEKRNEKADSIYSNPDDDPRGVWTSVSYVNPATKDKRPNLVYPLTNPFTNKEVNHPTNAWKYEKSRYEQHVKENKLWWGKSGENTYPRLKKFLYEMEGGMVPVDLWRHEDAGSTDSASKELENILGRKIFDFPKPKELIIKAMSLLINGEDNKDFTIIDFFAGSGTTLHATMQLNSEDGGHRQCILVTNNENNICEEVTYERNKRVINGYTTPKGVEVPGLKGNNLRYYQMDFIPREQSTANKHALMNAATDLLCIKEDLYEEVKPFVGLNFKSSVLRYFKSAEKQMLVVFNERAIEYIVPKICEVATKDNPLKIYVFSDGAYAYDDEFHEVKDLVQLCALPDAIYQAYMRVLPPRRYAEETLVEGDDAAEALNDEYEYSSKEGGMA